MAEYVEARMEEMLGEVEQLERVELLDHKEVRTLLRKRKSFEYKIQKRTKKKEDFLSYIQYESNLLKLIELRRDDTGYRHKKGEIEHSVISRINKLFKILEHRFQSDTKIWLSHIDFLKQVKWDSSVSKVYLRTLQVHNDKPNLWVASAKWEMEEAGSPDNARQIMLRGLRFHPTSRLLHREYLRLELLYVERLRKRKDILGLGALEEVHEENRDLVLDCQVAKVVYQAASEALKEPEFLVSMLVVAKQFSFAVAVQKEILEDLKTNYSNSAVTWDTLAREELEKCEGEEGNMKKRIKCCSSIYEEGLKKVGSEEMLKKYTSTLTELSQIAPQCSTLVLKLLIKCLSFGKEKNILAEEHFTQWLQILDPETQAQEMREILESANDKYPQCVDLWVKRIMFELSQTDVKKTIQVFKTAVEKLDGNKEDELKVWEVMMANMSARGDSEGAWNLLQEGVAVAAPRIAGPLRVLLLGQASNRGIEAAREVYQNYRGVPPFHLEFHNKMLQVEEENEIVSVKNVRIVHQARCDQFGRTEPLVWQEAANFEQDQGKPLDAARLICRAEATLEKHLVAEFITIKELADLES